MISLAGIRCRPVACDLLDRLGGHRHPGGRQAPDGRADRKYLLSGSFCTLVGG